VVDWLIRIGRALKVIEDDVTLSDELKLTAVPLETAAEDLKKAVISLDGWGIGVGLNWAEDGTTIWTVVDVLVVVPDFTTGTDGIFEMVVPADEARADCVVVGLIVVVAVEVLVDVDFTLVVTAVDFGPPPAVRVIGSVQVISPLACWYGFGRCSPDGSRLLSGPLSMNFSIVSGAGIISHQVMTLNVVGSRSQPCAL